METITAKSHFGTITFDGTTITIQRSMMTPQGRSTRHIPLKSVQAIQYAPAKFLGGYIAFTVAGGVQTPLAWAGNKSSRDENAVRFTANKRQAMEFEALYQAITAAHRELSA